jgi:hypothetical protein
MSERIQKTFTLSFNSKINSDLKMWEALQKLPKGYGKKLFQNLLEEKFGKSNSNDFELRMMQYLDLEVNSEYHKKIVKGFNSDSELKFEEKSKDEDLKVSVEKPTYKSNDSLEV